jgi:predicted nuclease of restriction endonuclease-like (RecB) superfamily
MQLHQGCSLWLEVMSNLLLLVMQQQEVQGRWEVRQIQQVMRVQLQARSAWQQLQQSTQQELCQTTGKLRLKCSLIRALMCCVRVTRMHHQQQQQHQQVMTRQLTWHLMPLQQMQMQGARVTV